MKRTLNQILKEMYPKPGDLPIWVRIPGFPDTYRRTTLGEYWSDVYAESAHDWEEIFNAPSA